MLPRLLDARHDSATRSDMTKPHIKSEVPQKCERHPVDGLRSGTSSHEEPVIVNIVDDNRRLLHYLREYLRVDQRHRKRFVECVVVPVHFG